MTAREEISVAIDNWQVRTLRGMFRIARPPMGEVEGEALL